MNNPSSDVFDVAIVGYGPTGLVAAANLGRLGHRVAVVERWPNLYGKPRITHIDGETARAVQSVADVDRALRDSIPASYTWVNGRGDVLLDARIDGHRPMGFDADYSVYQPDIEDAIDERVRSSASVEFLRGWAFSGLTQDDDGVTLMIAEWDPLRRSRTDQIREIRAKYVIAADGGRSEVRSALDVSRVDLGFNERWLNVDVEWVNPPDPEFAGTRQYCDPARGHMFMQIGSSRQRFEFALLDHESTEDFLDPNRAWSLLKEHHGLGPDDVRFIRQIVYTFESRIADDWKVGRVFLAGDAAHTMPPYLGQGACGGIRDAVNLTWKLDLVLSGRASTDLLETYELERRPHVTALTHGSIMLGAIANMHDVDKAAERDSAMLSGEVSPPPLGPPPLTSGVIRTGPEGTALPRVGTLVPQGRIRRLGRVGRFDDVVGAGFALVVRDVVALDRRRLALLNLIGVETVVLADIDDVDGVYASYLDDLDTFGYVTRPDFVLFGTTPDADGVGDLIDDLAHALRITDIGESDVEGPAAALHREIPYTRLTDYGMNSSDARDLLDVTARGRQWSDVASECADRRREQGRVAEESGHLLTAHAAYTAAAAAVYVAQMAVPVTDARKRRLYQRHVADLTSAAAVSESAVERLHVPYLGGELSGWLLLPASRAPHATVIIWGGLNGWGAAFLGMARALTDRGLACVLAEGPGQGLPLLEHDLVLDENVTAGFSRFIDVVVADQRLNGPIGIQGNSFGGLFAAHLAAVDQRVDAVGINGSPAAPSLPPGAPAAALGAFAAVMGSADRKRIDAVLDSLRFDPERSGITVPTLILHGDTDPLVDDSNPVIYRRAALPATTTYLHWSDGEHTLYNHAAERNAVIADWFADTLAARVDRPAG